jgi:hypothetical protein
MPFRYGIAEMRDIPHIFVRLKCEIDGQIQSGISADNLIPKWFTKDSETSYREDVDDMLAVIQAACQFAIETSRVSTVFALWQAIYIQQREWAAEHGYPPLLWNFGVSLVERALIDAFCRATGENFFNTLRKNSLGIRLDEIHTVLAGYQPADLLPTHALKITTARHTIGLSDPLTEEEIKDQDRLNDGLPQSLQASLKTYGLTHFKIKLSGVVSKDIYRLKRVLNILNQNGRFYFTLDGNEQFQRVDEFKAFWGGLQGDGYLASNLRHLLYVEQPLHRDAALCTQNQEPLRRWVDRPPMVIDESDSELDSLKIALDCGYSGTSHKNCKGIFKGIANACLLEHLRRTDPQGEYLLSGEDLATIGPIALLQDLAVTAALGIKHVERNGQHYFRGMSMFPNDIQSLLAQQHPDLYQIRPQGFISLKIIKGKISLKSVSKAPFGLDADIDLGQLTPLDQWDFSSLSEETPYYNSLRVHPIVER